ncbi:MAG: CvpA family protein [Candidatus Omnitrophota bacterium]
MSYFIGFLKLLNWIDIAILIIFVRILFISLKTGFVTEIYKILGALAATYLSLHYYSSIAGYFTGRFALNTAAIAKIESIAFALLSGIGYSFFLVLRLLLKRFINMEVVPTISRLGGLILGIVRAFLFGSLLLYFFLATGNSYLHKSVRTSFSGMDLVYLAPSTYKFFWDAVMSKLASREKFNGVVFEIEKDNTKKKK